MSKWDGSYLFSGAETQEILEEILDGFRCYLPIAREIEYVHDFGKVYIASKFNLN